MLDGYYQIANIRKMTVYVDSFAASFNSTDKDG